MFGMIQRVWRLFLKELSATVRDPRARILLIVPPVMQLIVFSFVATQEVTNARVGILNRDSGVESAALLRAFQAKPVFAELYELRDERELDVALENRKICAAVVVPQDFSQKFLAPNDVATIQLIADGRRANAAAILTGYLTQITREFGAETHELSSASRELFNANSPVVRRWFNPNLNARESFLPGLICLLMTTVGILTSATSISRERESGSFDQLLVSPASPLEIVFGKETAGVFLATCSATIVAGVVIWGFRLSLQGAFWLFLTTTVLYLTSIVAIGLFISSLSTTQQQSTLGCFIFMPPAIMTSGFAAPVENMPEWLQTLTLANPARWELVVLKELFLRGSQTSAILPNLIPLTIVAAISFGLACYMFRRCAE